MARTAKQPEPFDRAVSLILRAAADGRRVTLRQLAEGADMGLNRIGNAWAVPAATLPA